jgi:hypothetical protein
MSGDSLQLMNSELADSKCFASRNSTLNKLGRRDRERLDFRVPRRDLPRKLRIFTTIPLG